VDNVKMDLREMEWDGVDWIHLDQDRDQCRDLVITAMNLWVPLKCWEILELLHNWQLLTKDSAP
jgi:hypothetical protein